MGNLDLTYLKSSVLALKKSIDVYESILEASDTSIDLITTVKSGIIQNFEVAYEQSWKMLAKWLQQNVNPDIMGSISKKELYRIAAEAKLISNVEDWFRLHSARNLTSHTYSEESAEITFEAAISFIPVVDELITKLSVN